MYHLTQMLLVLQCKSLSEYLRGLSSHALHIYLARRVLLRYIYQRQLRLFDHAVQMRVHQACLRLRYDRRFYHRFYRPRLGQVQLCYRLVLFGSGSFSRHRYRLQLR